MKWSFYCEDNTFCLLLYCGVKETVDFQCVKPKNRIVLRTKE